MSHQTPKIQSNHCPECRRQGSKVGRITLESLLKPDPAGLITDEQFRFCDSVDCQTVYFGDNGTTFAKQDLAVRVGVKEHSAPRHVCYCFDHTIEEINAEVQETGQCTVLDDIKDRMKVACWCDTKSPKGTCCLGTVGKYVKIAMAEHMDGESEAHEEDWKESEDCCDNRAHSCSVSEACGVTGTTQRRTGGIAVGGSMLAALAASACCWLPLGLIVIGVSAGGVSAWFEHYRWLFLGITGILLGAGFYLVYRKPHCEPGSACAAPNRKVQRFNRSMLWIATVFVIASASFPKYVGYLLPKDKGIDISWTDDQIIVVSFGIAGMTCEACTIHLRNELVKVPGVLDVAVSYENSSAEIRFDASRPPATIDLSSAVESSGYKADLIDLNSESQ
tara:strand:+ start:1153 stop:2325 length:1173 start_codon:yes stop_codon:yes gene_type:complete